MKKIIAFGASNSQHSINKIFATYVAKQIKNTTVTVIDLNDFELPLFSVDLEADQGIPTNASRFDALIDSCDGVVISLAEHNGYYSAIFKNLLDWLSRIDRHLWKNKPILLLATSPGAQGGIHVLQVAKQSFPFFKGRVVGAFSLPSFHQNFSEGTLMDGSLNDILHAQIRTFQLAL
jgi:chromate reductase